MLKINFPFLMMMMMKTQFLTYEIEKVRKQLALFKNITRDRRRCCATSKTHDDSMGKFYVKMSDANVKMRRKRRHKKIYFYEMNIKKYHNARFVECGGARKRENEFSQYFIHCAFHRKTLIHIEIFHRTTFDSRCQIDEDKKSRLQIDKDFHSQKLARGC